ncbi:hypothetical protein GMDG_08819 [Pseudogymnoascus destructans 20631-21]|uniref:Uncharacterized protein n=1 Tax=Pseudogymnoascus destructans (strain ATCC MYA-4855 / 20631-21) TaxID=658429 RepID=L8FRZ8_PSED2|nr:hypothetical protein GMDG_08819 [Pseudogymnoascus destructans 20631-21]
MVGQPSANSGHADYAADMTFSAWSEAIGSRPIDERDLIGGGKPTTFTIFRNLRVPRMTGRRLESTNAGYKLHHKCFKVAAHSCFGGSVDSSFVDIDILLTKVRNPQSRTYFLDAVRAYKAGALRAALTAAWVAIAYDLIAKYRELSAQGRRGSDDLPAVVGPCDRQQRHTPTPPTRRPHHRRCRRHDPGDQPARQASARAFA